MFSYAGLIILLCLSQTSLAAKLPAGVNGCAISLNQTEFNKCVLNESVKMKQYFLDGLPEMKLPAFKNFTLPFAKAVYRTFGAEIDANLTKVAFNEILNFTIKDFEVNPRTLEINVTVNVESIKVNGNFDLEGSILFDEVFGFGTFKTNFCEYIQSLSLTFAKSNVNVTMYGKGKDVIDDDGVNRIQIDDLKIKTDIGEADILLIESPECNCTIDTSRTMSIRSVQLFLNSLPTIVRDITSNIIQDTLAMIGQAMITDVLSTVSKDDLIL